MIDILKIFVSDLHHFQWRRFRDKFTFEIITIKKSMKIEI